MSKYSFILCLTSFAVKYSANSHTDYVSAVKEIHSWHVFLHTCYSRLNLDIPRVQLFPCYAQTFKPLGQKACTPLLDLNCIQVCAQAQADIQRILNMYHCFCMVCAPLYTCVHGLNGMRYMDSFPVFSSFKEKKKKKRRKCHSCMKKDTTRLSVYVILPTSERS